ncbi:MAG: class I tRNA ligase family protein, partial [Pseudomonadota bacterium]
LIDQYGADALRFFMAAMESQGRDIKMDEQRVAGYRNFATKLWNAARFAQSNGIGASATLEPPVAELAVNRWIVAETVGCVQALDLALADLRFDEAANTIYQFVWSRFCDWYLELIKPVIQGEGGVPAVGAGADETRAVAGWVLDQILVMLHPFMPFITEEIWSRMGPRENALIVAKWPMADARALDPEAAKEIDWLIELVTQIRSVRTELNVPPSALVKLTTVALEHDEWFYRNYPILRRMARLDGAMNLDTAHKGVPNEIDDRIASRRAKKGSAQILAPGFVGLLDLEGIIDLDAERARLTKAIAAAEKERDGLAGRLNNPSFVEKARLEAVEKARADHAEKSAEAERLAAALARLG